MEDKRLFKRERETQAINLAVGSHWDEAVAVNKEILEMFPEDTGALNRLGRALIELGRYAEAKEAYEKTLKLEAENAIARKNINKLGQLLKTVKKEQKADRHKVAPELFIEETGKTGVVALVNIASKETLAKFSPGEQVRLVAKAPHLVIMTETGEYLGEVKGERDAHRLIKLMQGGNKYEAAIASVDDSIKVIIKEVYQHSSQKGRLSFPVKGGEGPRPYFKEGILKYELEGEDEFLSEEGEYPGEEIEEKESELLREGVSIIEEEIPININKREKEEDDESTED